MYSFVIRRIQTKWLLMTVSTSVSHPGSGQFSREGKNLSGGLISGSTFNQPEIGLQHQVRVGLVLVLQRAGGIVGHGDDDVEGLTVLAFKLLLSFPDRC